MMELTPYDSIAPFHRLQAIFRLHSIQLVQSINIVVCRHLFEDGSRIRWAFGMHQAPPEDRFDPPGQGHASMPARRLGLALLYRLTEEAPQALHRHLCLPALVLPFFFIREPQYGHFIAFIRIPLKSGFKGLI